MVLAQLGKSVVGALARMDRATVVDDKVLVDLLNDVSRALLQADVRFETVRAVQARIKAAANLQSLDRRRAIRRAVVQELRGMLQADPAAAAFVPRKGRQPASVVMFVGLQGSGKTTTCVKYADYHRRRLGFRPALVCADTFRAGALDQLAQNAAKAGGLPFYGSYMESDPVRVAVDGVNRFRNNDAGEGCDLIVVDTSGRHSQEAALALMEEMRQLAEATRPDLVVLVVDATIGQAAFHQALAFKQTAAQVGAVIVTKMDAGGGHAKGGGALSAVAATKSPVIFIGTGEHIADLEAFDATSFVSRLLGMGDLSGFLDKIQETMPVPTVDQGQGLEQQLLRDLTDDDEGEASFSFTLRAMYTVLRMDPRLFGDKRKDQEKVGQQQQQQAKIKRYMTVMDSMTDAELDGDDPTKLLMTKGHRSRINRIARGSGSPVNQVVELLEEHKRMAEILSKSAPAAHAVRRRQRQRRSDMKRLKRLPILSVDSYYVKQDK